MIHVTRADDVDAKTLEHIRTYGWEKILVGAGHCARCGDCGGHAHGPVFAYSIGLSLTYQHPELLVSAPVELAPALLDYGWGRLHQGERLTPGTLYHGFFKTQPLQVVPLLPVHKRKMGQAVRILHTRDFAALQVVYPDATGTWPWDRDCDKGVRRVQKLYCQRPRSK